MFPARCHLYQETLWRMTPQEWVYSPRQDPAHATAASWSLAGVWCTIPVTSCHVMSFLLTQDPHLLCFSCLIKKLITGWLTFFQFDCLTPLCCLDQSQTVIASKALEVFQQHLPGNQIHHQVMNHQQNPCGRNLWPVKSDQCHHHKPSIAQDPQRNLPSFFEVRCPAILLLENVWTTKSQVHTSSSPQKAFRMRPSISNAGLQSITFHAAFFPVMPGKPSENLIRPERLI